ncbi:MAG: cephalosporin hydroxylase [Planctomycetes bacterium]|nr:cephalosporin hydroxylase [Planctomycetota bacterium]
MSDKKLYTREEFEELRNNSAGRMAAYEKLQADALNVLVKADHYRWIHQTNWFGEPILNLPQDMFALQEIIFNTRPKFIIESGVAWGGSLLFYSTLMEVLGGERIIGIDTYIPDDLRRRLASHGKLSERLTLINGSSTEQDTISQVKAIVGNCREVMVMLDSYHTHEHVLKELRLYSPLIGKDFYLVCGDTVVEDVPKQVHRSRPWGHGNNPKTALLQFLEENNRFEVDQNLKNKLLFTCNADGYLRCRKD